MAEIKPWDTAYEIPENPEYDPVIRALKCSDPANADTIFNPLVKQIITNIHAVKLDNDKRAEKPTITNITLLKTEWKGSTAPYTINKSVNGIIKTGGAESLIYVVPFSNTIEIGNCNIIAESLGVNNITFKADTKPTGDVGFQIINAGTVNI